MYAVSESSICGLFTRWYIIPLLATAIAASDAAMLMRVISSLLFFILCLYWCWFCFAKIVQDVLIGKLRSCLNLLGNFKEIIFA